MRKLTVLLVCCIMLAACVTVRMPDGTETTRVDTEAIQMSIVLAEQGLALAQQAYDLYQQYEAGDSNEDAPADLARMQSRIDYWTAILQRLYTAYAETVPDTPTVSAAP